MGFMCVQITRHKANLGECTSSRMFSHCGLWGTGGQDRDIRALWAIWLHSRDISTLEFFWWASSFSCFSLLPLLQCFIAGSWAFLQEALRGTSCFFNHSLATVPFIGLLGSHILGSPSYQLIDFFSPCLEKRKNGLQGNKKRYISWLIETLGKIFSLKSAVRRNAEFCGMLGK